MYLYLNFKCPSCGHINANANEVGAVSLTLSRNTGEQYPQQHQEPVSFMCGSCSHVSAWEVDLKPL